MLFIMIVILLGGYSGRHFIRYQTLLFAYNTDFSLLILDVDRRDIITLMACCSYYVAAPGGPVQMSQGYDDHM